MDTAWTDDVQLSGQVPKGIARPVGGLPKRTFDILVASLALLMMLPLLLLAIAVVGALHGRPVLFGQKRRGFGGQEFTCWKIRTMVADSSMRLDDLLAGDGAARAEWDRTRKLRQDPRVTPVGDFLRRTSLDELPQLWNVIAGQMSLVGPRPVVDSEVQFYGSAFGLYAAARPGITGAWQVSGRSDTSYEARVMLDAAYVQGWSLTRDLSILSRTVPAVLLQRGSR